MLDCLSRPPKTQAFQEHKLKCCGVCLQQERKLLRIEGDGLIIERLARIKIQPCVGFISVFVDYFLLILPLAVPEGKRVNRARFPAVISSSALSLSR